MRDVVRVLGLLFNPAVGVLLFCVMIVHKSFLLISKQLAPKKMNVDLFILKVVTWASELNIIFLQTNRQHTPQTALPNTRHHGGEHARSC